ncbi:MULTISPECIES: tyrosine-type recombinase/integrase [unclassified Streptomyces]|uniref:tyrosine-type recombinase/integrase n=1 Tax=unclassified Streptomyces TaxID=2593676 RepID=UPI002E180D01|nr:MULTISPECIES: tyrosine-type recombinase/integrase [unclassified Streptomyces]
MWLRYCTETALPPAAVTTGTLVLFVEWACLQPGWKAGTFKAPTSIDRHLAGIVVTARQEYRLTLDRRVGAEARALLKAKKKAMDKAGEQHGRGPAPALLVSDMERILPTIPDTIAGIRDLAIMTTHFACAAREHELAAQYDRHVTEDEHGRGLVSDLRVSKTYPRVVQILYGSRAHLCPVRAVSRWREVSRPAPDDPLFRQLHSGGETILDNGLSPEGIGDVLTRLGERAGLEKRLTGHSPRRGLVTESARAGNDERQAEKQGGWVPGSRVMRKYREDDDGFKENALHGVL